MGFGEDPPGSLSPKQDLEWRGQPWELGVVVNFTKKGELAPICKNWRGITLLTTVRKMLGKSILQRMKDGLGDRRLWNEQAPDFVRR